MNLPLTGRGVVDLIITELCVFSVGETGGLTLLELMPGVTLAEVEAKTGCAFAIGRDLAAQAASLLDWC